MYEFDARKVKENLVEWIQDFFELNGKDCTAVVAISGGKDSSVVAALCVEALGKERVFGVLLPNGEQADIDASKLLVSHLGIDSAIINIKDSFEGMLHEVEKKLPGTVSKQTVTNLPARLRMAATYAVAQSMNGRVANTCNLSEDWVGYATRYGDAAGDFSPLSRLTVQEVKAVGLELGLPEKLESSRAAVATEPYPGRWTHHILVTAPEEIDGELLAWLRQAYEFAESKR